MPHNGIGWLLLGIGSGAGFTAIVSLILVTKDLKNTYERGRKEGATDCYTDIFHPEIGTGWMPDGELTKIHDDAIEKAAIVAGRKVNSMKIAGDGQAVVDEVRKWKVNKETSPIKPHQESKCVRIPLTTEWKAQKWPIGVDDGS